MRVDGKPVTLLVALVRTLLICLVVPPVIFNRDHRGLHDLVAGTVTVDADAPAGTAAAQRSMRICATSR